MNRRCAPALAAALAACLVAAFAAPVQARDGAQPPDLVQVVAATPTSLTITWTPVTGATSYVVEIGEGLTMVDRSVAGRPDQPTLTVTGLTPGQLYCAVVRERGGDANSPRSCHPTIRAQGPARGARYRVLTYNLCSVPCGHWADRREPAVAAIRAADPDVIALQETLRTGGVDTALSPAYDVVRRRSAKWLLVRHSRFGVVASGEIDLGAESAEGKHRWAVWGEVADHESSDRHVIFVSAHFAPGDDTEEVDAARRRNARLLVAGLAAVNPGGLPVVVAGDFNSHAHRVHDSPAAIFHEAGLWDCFDLAERLTRPHYNSVNQFRSEPVIAATFGDHVDHVWVDPATSRVLAWANVAPMDGENYAEPLPSDHNPIAVDVAVSGHPE